MMNSQKLEDYWRKHYTKYLKSGQSQLAYCNSNNLKTKSFYGAITRYGLKSKARKQPAAKFIELTSEPAAPIEIFYKGITVKLPPHSDEGVFRTVLSALGAPT